MRFLFVDKITSISSDAVAGEVTFPLRAPLSYPCKPNGPHNRQIAPGLIGEALGQLVSWKIMSDGKFTVRPVYLFSDKLIATSPVYPGQTVRLNSTIQVISDESVTFSGVASVFDTPDSEPRMVAELVNCTNFFLPISEVEDPIEVEERFHSLVKPNGAPILDESPSPGFRSCIQRVEELIPGQKIRAACKVDGSNSFYADHFSRRPITPIVVLNEVMGHATSLMMGKEDLLIPRAVLHTKIKSFVGPDEDFEILINRNDLSTNSSGIPADILITVELLKAGKRILRTQHLFAEETNV